MAPTDAPETEPPAWHNLAPQQTFTALQSSNLGLSESEAARRLEERGLNQLQFEQSTGWVTRLLRQFNNALIYVLLVSAAITAALNLWPDTGVILAVVVINAFVGFLQEGRAERAMQRIREMLSPTAKVVRASQAREVDARQLVPGDIVLLEAGDRIPADLRILRGKNLEVDESLLTGESLAVEKSSRELTLATDLAERSNLGFAGTLATRGIGRGIVVATGVDTQIGQISQMLGGVEQLKTPLLTKLATFGRALSLLIVILALSIALFGLFVRDLEPASMLLVAVSIAVAAIPEGLPPVITITLAIGVQIMARHNAIVRHLPAVEALGEVNVICTDKTGTLTRNEMTVRDVELSDASLFVSGAGYAPEGTITLQSRSLDPAQCASLLGPLIECALNCNDADLYRKDDTWAVTGDPTEGSLLALGYKAGLDPAASRQSLPRLDLIPFESDQRFMATLHKRPDGTCVIFAKGAPEQVTSMCGKERLSDGRLVKIDADRWEAKAHALAASGRRVLALAKACPDSALNTLSIGDVHGQLEMLGLVGIADPPRPEAKAAVDRCRRAGIQVKMVTGDHAGTATSVASELGLDNATTTLVGMDIDALPGDAFSRAAAEINVFARASPEHKLRLVTSLQQQGLVVAMTGDGVNDAPALKRADIGVAMGRKGTQAAREAASMVLADDNFASIVRAVEQGRVIYDNIRKSIIFLLPTSLAEALVIATAVVMGYELPMTPAQILWVNMITAVTLGVALAFEPAEADVMLRDPRRQQEPILSKLTIWRTLFVGTLMLLGVTAVFLLESSHSVEYARTVAVNMLVGFEAVYLLSSRRLRTALLSAQGLRGNPVALISILAVMLFQMLFTYEPTLSGLFNSRPITLESWGLIALLAMALLLIVELEKRIRSLFG